MMSPQYPTSPAFFSAASDRHAALAQLHRWWLIYESPDPETHFDIFAENFVVESATGQVKGLEAYKKRLQDFNGWQNAHHLQQCTVTTKSEQEIELTAEIHYQNIRPDGQQFAYVIHYEAWLERRPNQLPLFKRIKLQPVRELEDKTFTAAFMDNRLRSFTHSWLYLMETAQGRAEAFKELLGSDFSLTLGGPAPVTTWSGFAAWVQSVPTWLALSSHTIKDMAFTANADKSFTARLAFDWQGVASDGSPMIAQTQHEWLLRDKRGARFAKLEKMEVKVLVPFQKVGAR